MIKILNFKFKFNFFLSFIFILFLIINTNAYTPTFNLDKENYESGQVNITGGVSSGVRLNLEINGNFISSKDMYAENKTIYLNDYIKNIQVPYGTNIHFINNNSNKVYKLNFSGTYKILNYEESFDFKQFYLGDLIYKNEDSGISKKITYKNQQIPFNFQNLSSYLNDGKNSLKFTLIPLHTGDFESFSIFKNISYDKYLVNIIVDNYSKIINSNEIRLSGEISDSNSKLYYVLNTQGVIANIGVLSQVDLNSNKFNFTIGNLIEGNNSIRFISMDKNSNSIFNGEKIIKVKVDTIAPKIQINSAQYMADLKGIGRVNLNADLLNTAFINSRKIKINLSADAYILNYTFNGKNFTKLFENNSILLSLNLVEGKNNLTLRAYDLAGNVDIQSHQIDVNTKKPDFVKDSLEPKELFNSPRVAHFPFVSIKGKTTKPNVRVEVFTIPKNTKDKSGKILTCSDFEPYFLRNLGQLDNSKNYADIDFNPKENQISLTDAMFQKQSFTTDENGNFGGGNMFDSDKSTVIIGLKEKTFTSSDYYHSENEKDKENPKVNSVKSFNTICFYLQDKYGNYKTIPYAVTLDAGNTAWKPGEITTIPNTLYSGEIESSSSNANGNSVSFGLIARIKYVGGGKITSFSGVQLRSGNNKDSRYIRIGNLHYSLDKNTGDLILYVPIDVLKRNIEPAKYPNKLEFWIDVSFTYTVDNMDIPIDTVNPVHLKAVLNVERPLDHTKWLTPETIDKYQGYLNKTIKFTEKSAQVMQYASIGGVIACTAAKLIYGVQLGSLTDEEEKHEILRKIAMVCDRVACTSSPRKCDQSNTNLFNPGDKKYFSENDLLGTAVVSDGKDNQIAQFTKLKLGPSCNIGDKKDSGVYITGKVDLYNMEKGQTGWGSSVTSKYISNKCVPKDSNGNINLASLSGACYDNNYPNFDGTRCNFFTLDGNEGPAGWNPANNIIESIRCGCITDTYSHLKNYLKIQKSIYGCLEQAKLGEVKGSYCERLLSKAVCDVATGAIFTLMKDRNPGRKDSRNKDVTGENIITKSLRGADEGDKFLNERYKGTFFTKAGLATDQIVNKMCIAGISGDWSVLTDNILNSIDQNEVEPTFGPLFPESRLGGYDPLTGDLVVTYRFTYGVLSGGQQISSKVIFICNPSAPYHEYCPTDYITTEDASIPTTLRTQRLFVGKGQSRQDTIVLKDTKAKFRFNQIQMIHTYVFQGKQVVKKEEPESIFPNGELFTGCSFTAGVIGSGAGFHCEALFNDYSIISGFEINKRKTKLIPSHIFYPENQLFLNLFYSKRDGENVKQSGFYVVSKATCRGLNGKDSTKLTKTKVNILNKNKQFGNKLIPLFKIPTLGDQVNIKTWKYSADLSEFNCNKTNPCNIVFNSTEKDKYENIQFISSNLKIINLNKNNGIILNRKYNVTKIDDSRNSNIEIASNSPILIKVIDKSNKVSFSNPSLSQVEDSTKFDKLQPGKCSLEIKLLPLNKEDEINSIQDFDNYNTNSEDSDIKSNVIQSDSAKFDFIVAKKSKEDKINFNLVEPREGQIICNDNNEIKYIYETSTNKKIKNVNLNISISLKEKINKLNFNIKDLSLSIINPNQINNKIYFKDLKENKIYDAILTYDLKKDKTIVDSGKINFKINNAKNCNFDENPILS